MTIPPPQSSGPRSARPSRKGRHSDRGAGLSLGVTQLIQTSDLPAGINALASADGKTIMVRSGLDKATRRAAIRQVLAQTHRFPGLVLWPVLIDARLRRLVYEFGEWIAAAGQHLGGVVSGSPVVAVVATVTVASAAGIGISTVVTQPSGPPPGSVLWHQQHPVHAPPLPVQPLSWLGVYEPSSPASYSGVEQFGRTAGREPNLALYYSGWYESFRSQFAQDAYDHGAYPVVQMNPEKVTLQSIVAGKSDTYLENFADAVADFGHQVVIGFAHEPDAFWYTWGDEYVSPSVWVAAWQHVVNVFRKQGADNVTWLWTMNVLGSSTVPVADYWPGDSYVTWIGIDGYYMHLSDTYASVFGSTISAIQGFAAGEPILISETAIGPPGTEPSQIENMYAGIRTYGNLGLIWFDENKPDEPYALEGDPGAIKVFRQMTAIWRLQQGQ